jgi:hypothetical protein
MDISEREYEMVGHAVKLIIKRKRRAPNLSEAESAIVNFMKMVPKNERQTSGGLLA